MKKIELLAPAGSYEALVAAVTNGADAIYLGGTLFNARAFATNFTNEKLKEAVEFAHLHNVKIYVTVNTVFYDEEFEQLIQYLDFLYSINVDAVIIQDLGLFDLLKQNYPDMEIHLSTQASVHQLEGVKFFEEKGAHRVVLARENTIEEIQHICQNTNLDIEVFVHGALCMGYSGQCLMSSMIGKRSGNRGKCAQPCRLGYILKEDQKLLDKTPHYLLSAKDICALENIGEYIKAGVTSFKIEGRMKRPEYVGLVVKSYREAIDRFIEHKPNTEINIQKQKINQMFNRGFSLGHAFSENKLITYHFPGNHGIAIGKVLQYNPKTKRITILLSKKLNQGDGIRFGYEDIGRTVNKIYIKDRLVNQGNAKDIIEIEFDTKINKDTTVFKTTSIELINEVNNEIKQHHFTYPLDIKIIGKINQPLILELNDGKYTVIIESETKIEKALNQALSKERIIEQICKLGNTIYKANKIDIELDECIQFPIKNLNQLRREAIELLNQKRTKNLRSNKKTILPIFEYCKKKIKNVHVQVSTIDQFYVAKNQKVNTIYIPIELLKLLPLTDIVNSNVIPYITRINDDEKLKIYKDILIKYSCTSIMVGDIGAMHYFKEYDVILDTSLNITNSYALNSSLISSNDIILSYELTPKQLNHLHSNKQLGIVVYGKTELMIAKYCPISQHYFNEKKPGCNICKQHQYYLNDRKREDFPIIMDDLCRMHLYNTKPLFIDKFNTINVDFIVLKFVDETKDKVFEIINDYQLNINKNNKSLIKQNYSYTQGYFK